MNYTFRFFVTYICLQGMRTNFLTILLSISASYAVAQQTNVNTYSATLSGQVNGWNALELPKEMYAHIKDLRFSDVRLYGVSKNGDTLETPYYIEQAGKRQEVVQVSFKQLNTVKKGQDYFFTFQISDSTAINEILLDFANTNYNWFVDLEGSNDQKEWFHALEKYRIVAIKNEQTSYQFSKLVFQQLSYQYFRLKIRTPQEKPVLRKATVLTKSKEVMDNFKCSITSVAKDSISDRNSTIIFFETATAVPLHHLGLKVKHKQDYYRNATLYSLNDSFKLASGKWGYRYGTIWTGIISSLELPNLRIDGPIAKKYKLKIENNDNPPLKVSINTAEAEKYLLMGQFESGRKYFITFGDKDFRQPSYDIAQFKNPEPQSVNRLVMGTIQLVNPSEEDSQEVQVINKIGLWVVMLLIIGLLSWFTFSMLSVKSSSDK